MSSLSIRKLPRDLEKALLREAKAKGRTKTDLVVAALKERYHLGNPADKKKKIRHFFGKMTQEEFKSFKEATHDFSKLEEELWS